MFSLLLSPNPCKLWMLAPSSFQSFLFMWDGSKMNQIHKDESNSVPTRAASVRGSNPNACLSGTP